MSANHISCSSSTGELPSSRLKIPGLAQLQWGVLVSQEGLTRKLGLWQLSSHHVKPILVGVSKGSQERKGNWTDPSYSSGYYFLEPQFRLQSGGKVQEWLGSEVGRAHVTDWGVWDLGVWCVCQWRSKFLLLYCDLHLGPSLLRDNIL